MKKNLEIRENIPDQPIKFSVIMVVYNSESYISKSIKSVIKQTYNLWELVIVDDGSKDQSFEIAKSYEKTDKRIKCFKLIKNHGQGFARNYAIKKSTGNWLSTLDSDDIYLPKKLEKQKDIILNSTIKNLILIGSGLTLINNNDKFLKNFYYPEESKRLKKNLLKLKKFPAHSSIIYSKNAFLKAGGYNELYFRSMDYDLWLRISNFGSFLCAKDILINYRITEFNASNTKTNKFTQYHYSIAALVCNYLRKNNLYDPSKNQKNFNLLLKTIDFLYNSTFQSKIIETKKLIQYYPKIFSILIFFRFFIQKPNLCLRLIIERLGYMYFFKKVLNYYIKHNKT